MSCSCQSAKNRFEFRNDCCEFLGAGHDPLSGRVIFLGGFTMCHRRDYSDVLGAVRRALRALEAVGVSNFKLSLHGIVHHCRHCGAHLRAHYGEDGGLLRDDEFVLDLRGA